MARNYDYNGDPCGEYGAAVRESERLSKELARLRITDEEREAIERLCGAANDMIYDDRAAGGCNWQEDEAAIAVVRGLLNRTK